MEDQGQDCPLCGALGEHVAVETVSSLVRSDTIIDETAAHYICKTPSCPTVYFSQEKHYLISEVKVPLWYKADATERIICYCAHVTEGDIRQAVQELKTQEIKQIIKATGAMQNSDCLHLNPTGKCCYPVIKELLHNLEQ